MKAFENKNFEILKLWIFGKLLELVDVHREDASWNFENATLLVRWKWKEKKWKEKESDGVHSRNLRIYSKNHQNFNFRIISVVIFSFSLENI